MIRAGIIGSGSIASGYDDKNSDRLLTHGHMYYSLDEFELIGFYDVNRNRSIEASEKWGGDSFDSIESLLDSKLQVISICVPDEYHYDVFNKVVRDENIKVIIMEKPVCKTLDEIRDIEEKIEKYGKKMFVNYSRSYVPDFKNLVTDYKFGKYGEFIYGTGYYGKGFVHNGSHMIDFLLQMFSKIDGFEISKSYKDIYDDDLNYDISLNIRNGVFNMVSIDSRNYSIFEMEFLFEKCRIKVLNSGFDIVIEFVGDSSVFKGYKNLNKVKNIDTDLGRHMMYLGKEVIDYFGEKDNNDSFKRSKLQMNLITEVLRS
ncbi:MAG: Gfo/Idh/MocA family oxidoreductase [Firmicutes bacterium]|jgi:predicted dehydrogenase|nr:Gfo/Idh/MocA family oxidoreductase [Bacillota bacterium]